VRKDTTIAVDLAKSVFEVAVSHRAGQVRERWRLTRQGFLRFFGKRRPATVLMEACGSAHHWGRQLEELGHRVVLLPPHVVHRYVRGNKTDRADVKALLEAYRNEEIQAVPLKSVGQQSLAALHRLRSGWSRTRTARMNSLRGLLREFGVTIPVGARNVVPRVRALLEDAESALPEVLRSSFEEALVEILQLEERIERVEEELKRLAAQTPVVRQLRSIPGIGLLGSTALVSVVGDMARFPSGRHFASYLGLVPREHSSGGVRRLGRITKRGDAYLRMLLIHGARSVLWNAKHRRHKDALRRWALRVEQLRGPNKAAVALANKMARFVWAVWKKGKAFELPGQFEATAA